jgi:hypothetical protein
VIQVGAAMETGIGNKRRRLGQLREFAGRPKQLGRGWEDTEPQISLVRPHFGWCRAAIPFEPTEWCHQAHRLDDTR